ncbi:MAG TPA: tetratricopeptide repeat protein [Vicinamibacterales bacterium]
MAVKTAAAPGKSSEKAVKQQLDRILGSATFQQVERLKRFITFIVTEAAAGRADELKEYVVGVQVFGKESSFDPRTDPIVRVQARRLRARLLRYYHDEGQHDEVIIDLPKGGYAPVFKRREGRPLPKPSLTTALASRNTIAVVPFADHSENGDLEYFCAGLTQELIYRFTRIKGLRVIAVDDDDKDGRQRAGMVLRGSVRRANGKVRVTTHLVDSPSGSYVWSESIDAPVRDTLEAHDAIATTIIERLQPDRVQRGEFAWDQRPIENLAAHNLYLQGRYHLNQRTEEGLVKAVDFFDKAITEDPQYAAAHSGLSDAYSLLAHYGVRGPADVWAKAASGAATAVLLDGNSAEARTSLAHVKSTQDWDWRAAEREFQRAVTLDPKYATAHHWYGMSCLVPMGRLDDALDQLMLAQSLDPVSSIIARDVGVLHYYRRNFSAALEQCDHTIELNPHFAPAYLTLSLVQEQSGDPEEALAALERAVSLSPLSPRMHGALGRSLALAGRRDEATRTLRQLEAMAGDRYVSPFEFASIHVALGQIDVGFRWLHKAREERVFELLAIRVDPRFDSLRGDSRFDAIVEQMAFE